MLEKNKKPCGYSDTNENNNQRGVSDYHLFESLKNAAPNEEVFAILKRLGTDAGDITIRDLFACTTEDVGQSASNAIAIVKTIGFLALNNDKCCHKMDDPFKMIAVRKKQVVGVAW